MKEGEKKMQKELFPKRIIDVTFSGLTMPGVPPSKGELTVRIVTCEKEEKAIIDEAREKYPDQIPENAPYSIKELPKHADPWDR